jgi:sarcosine oxidase gamma subunit
MAARTPALPAIEDSRGPEAFPRILVSRIPAALRGLHRQFATPEIDRWHAVLRLIRDALARLAAAIGIAIDSTHANGSSKTGMSTPIQIGPDMNTPI